MHPPTTVSTPGRDHRGSTVRMFFALWPDDAARAALAGLAEAIAGETGGRAPAAANLHLTLSFVGEVAPDRVDLLLGAGRDVAAEIAPFTLVLDRLGAFRGGGIAWIAATEIPSGLAAMAYGLAHRLSSAGFRVDQRAYAPHLTLARKCSDAADCAARRERRVARRGAGTRRIGAAAGRVVVSRRFPLVARPHRDHRRLTVYAGPRATGRAGSAHHSLHDPG